MTDLLRGITQYTPAFQLTARRQKIRVVSPISRHDFMGLHVKKKKKTVKAASRDRGGGKREDNKNLTVRVSRGVFVICQRKSVCVVKIRDDGDGGEERKKD